MNRTKRKRRKKRTEKEQAPTGSERVKVIDMKTGKKVRGNILFNQEITHFLVEFFPVGKINLGINICNK